MDNIKMDLREVGCDPRDWIALAEDRDQWQAYVRAVTNLRVPRKPINQLVSQAMYKNQVYVSLYYLVCYIKSKQSCCYRNVTNKRDLIGYQETRRFITALT